MMVSARSCAQDRARARSASSRVRRHRRAGPAPHEVRRDRGAAGHACSPHSGAQPASNSVARDGVADRAADREREHAAVRIAAPTRAASHVESSRRDGAGPEPALETLLDHGRARSGREIGAALAAPATRSPRARRGCASGDGSRASSSACGCSAGRSSSRMASSRRPGPRCGPRGGRGGTPSPKRWAHGVARRRTGQCTPPTERPAIHPSRASRFRALCSAANPASARWRLLAIHSAVACRSPPRPLGPGLRGYFPVTGAAPTDRSGPAPRGVGASPHCGRSCGHWLWTIGESTWALQRQMTCGRRSRQRCGPSSPKRRGTPGSRASTPSTAPTTTSMLGVPSSVAVERIRTSYLGLLADAVQALTGVPAPIELIVDTAPAGRRDDAAGMPRRRPAPIVAGRANAARPPRPSPPTPGPAPS